MESELKGAIKRYFDTVPNPAMIINRDLKCALSNKKCPFKVNEDLSKVFGDSLDFTSNEYKQLTVIVKGEKFCARIIPITDDMKLCELFTLGNVMDLAKDSDAFGEVLPLIVSAECNSSCIGKKLGELLARFHADKNFEYSEDTLSIKRSWVELESIIKSVLEYSNLYLGNQTREIVDVGELVNEVVKFANEILSESGRCVKYFVPGDLALVNTSKRHTINTVAHAINNALMLSPKDSVPLVFIKWEPINGKRFIVVQIINELKSKGYDFNYSKAKFEMQDVNRGIGFSIIERFVKETDGLVSFDFVDGKFITSIKLPQHIPEPSHIVYLASPKTDYLEMDDNLFASNIVEILMQVVNIYTLRDEND